MHKTKLAVILPLAILLCAFSCHGQVTVGGANAPVINSGPPQNGQVGVLYTFTASGSGGTLPYTWSTVPSPAITGVGAINASTGVMTGTPTTAGTYNFVLQLVDALGQQATAPFTVQISNALTITSGNPPNGVAGVSYGPFSFTASGGTAPYSWSLASGSLPSGVTLNGSTGALSGSPVGVGTSLFSVKATDNVGAVALAPPVGQFTVVITGSAPTCGPPTFTCSSKSLLTIPSPAAPFSGTTGQNQIKYDASINGTGTGTTGVDPIARLTDSTVGGTSFTLTPSGSAQDNICNVGTTMCAVIKSGSGCNIILGFNPSTMQITNTGALSCLANSKDIAWSRTNANVLYTETATGSVYKTTFTGSPSSFTQVLLFTPTSACGTLVTGSVFDGLFTISENDATLNGDWTSSGQGSPGYVWSYDLVANHCAAIYTGATTNNLLHYNGTLGTITETPTCTFPVQIHASGGFANGTWQRFSAPCAGTSTVHFWQIDSTTLFHCPAFPGGHNAEGFNTQYQLNNPHWAYGDVTTGNPAFCTLTTLGTTWITNGVAGDLENHIGANYVRTTSTSTGQDQSFFVGGTGWVNGYTGIPPTIVNPGVNEIFAITFSPYQWVRFAHNFTSGQTNCPSCDFRTYEGIVGTSQDGKFALFSSDMLLGLGTDSLGNPRQDVFIVRLD